MKKILSLLLSVMLLISGIPAFADEMYVVAQKDITVTYNGETILFPDARPLIQNGKTLVPVRAIMERAKLSVDFDGAERKVTATKDGLSIMMQIDSTEATVTEDGVSETILLDEPARIIDGRTFVPIRFIAESMNLAVNWNPNYREVIIIDTAEWEQEIAENSKFLSALLDLSMHPEHAKVSNFSSSFSMSFQQGEEKKALSANITGIDVFDGTNTGINLSVSADLSHIAPLLSDSKKPDEVFLGALAKKHNLNFDIVIDKENNLYVKSPGIISILEESGKGELAQKIGDSYIKISLADYFTARYGLDADAVTDGYESGWVLLEAMITADKNLYSQSVALIDGMMDNITRTYADSSFTKSDYYQGAKIWCFEPGKADYTKLSAEMNDYLSAIFGTSPEAGKDTKIPAITLLVTDDVPGEIKFSHTGTPKLQRADIADAKSQTDFSIASRKFDSYKDGKISIPRKTVDIEDLLGCSLKTYFENK
ncbi:MAG: copper amine oxidase N-terminal domain-containing protein [Clostridia bacterium]|nr:copper amine oxidase N-terminal domain-containing protein [Clostridia bacterium]